MIDAFIAGVMTLVVLTFMFCGTILVFMGTGIIGVFFLIMAITGLLLLLFSVQDKY